MARSATSRSWIGKGEIFGANPFAKGFYFETDLAPNRNSKSRNGGTISRARKQDGELFDRNPETTWKRGEIMSSKTYVVMKIVLWTFSIALVLLIGICYFPKECEGLDFLGALYYSIRLFILEHDLSHFPKSGPLIFIYFFAPLVAVSAVGSAISYFVRFTPSLRIKWKNDHVVVCGVGRTGKIMAATLKKNGVPVVGIDNGCPDDFEQWRTEHRVPMIFGDFMSRPILTKAGALKARAVLFASGDDLANLEAAVGAYDWLRTKSGPIRLLWVHVANDRLADTARVALRTSGAVGIRIFDTYDIAATKMVAKYFGRKIRQGITEIDILGFGKFGQDLMEVIVRDAGAGEAWKIRVIDVVDRKNEVASIAENLNVPDKVEFQKADIMDLYLRDEVHRAFFLCTDDDIGNLAAALMLSGKMHADHIYVRMAKWPMPAIEERLRGNGGITFININDLVERGIRDLPGLFVPAKPSRS